MGHGYCREGGSIVGSPTRVIVRPASHMLRARENQADFKAAATKTEPATFAAAAAATTTSRCRYIKIHINLLKIPEKVSDLEARGRKVEELDGVATVPRLSKGVRPAGFGQLVESQKQISRLHFRVRHAYRLVVGVQLEGVRCNDAVQARSVMYDVTANATVGGVELSSHHHIKRGEHRLAPTLGGRCL